MKIGILVPGSALFPTCGTQFCDGAELGLIHNNIEDALIIRENIGNGANKEVVLDKANKLLLQDDVDVVIAYTGFLLYEPLARLFTAHKKLLILAEMGGSISFNRELSPYVFYLSLDEWTANRRLGMHLAQNYSSLISALSFMEVGYHLNYAFITGFEQGGGKVTGYHMAPLKPESEYFETLRGALDNGEHDLFYCGFIGADAEMFFDKMGDAIARSGIAIAGPGLLAMPGIVAKYGHLMPATKTASAYYTAIDSPENKRFLEDFKDINEQDADPFAMLGYECGTILATAAVYSVTGKFRTLDTIAQMEKQAWITPRGLLKFNAEKHYSVSGCYFAETDDHNNIITHTLEAEDMEDWRSDTVNQPSAAWLNPYPCT